MEAADRGVGEVQRGGRLGPAERVRFRQDCRVLKPRLRRTSPSYCGRTCGSDSRIARWARFNEVAVETRSNGYSADRNTWLPVP